MSWIFWKHLWRGNHREALLPLLLSCWLSAESICSEHILREGNASPREYMRKGNGIDWGGPIQIIPHDVKRLLEGLGRFLNWSKSSKNSCGKHCSLNLIHFTWSVFKLPTYLEFILFQKLSTPLTEGGQINYRLLARWLKSFQLLLM